MGLQKAEVFTIRALEYKESDYILTLFGRNEGKFTALAKGARKSEKRFGATFDLLNLSEVVYYEGSNLDFVSQADLVESWESLRTRGHLLEAALNSARLLNNYCQPEDPQPAVFDTFLSTLRALEEMPSNGRVVQLAFYLKLLGLSGVQPNLNSCIYCGKPADGDPGWVFSPSAGGMICADCTDGSEISIRLEEGLRKSLHTLSRLPQDRAGIMSISEDRLDRGFKYLDRFASYHFQTEAVESSE